MKRLEKKDNVEEKTRVRKVRSLRRSTHWKVYMLSRRQVIGKYWVEKSCMGRKERSNWGLIEFLMLFSLLVLHPFMVIQGLYACLSNTFTNLL